MILVIDNYDSFTFNLVQLLGTLGAEVEVARNDALDADAFVLPDDVDGLDPEALATLPPSLQLELLDRMRDAQQVAHRLGAIARTLALHVRVELLRQLRLQGYRESVAHRALVAAAGRLRPTGA